MKNKTNYLLLFLLAFVLVSVFVFVYNLLNPKQYKNSSAQVYLSSTLAPMTCEVKLVTFPSQLYINNIMKFVAVISSGSPISKVVFSSNSEIVTLNPQVVTTGPYPYYQTYVRANQLGHFTLTAEIYLAESSSPSCSTSYEMDVLPVPTQWPTKPPSATMTPVTCTLKLTPSPLALPMKGNSVLTANVTLSGGSINKVTFQSSDTRIATVNPLYDSTYPYSVTVNGLKKGSTYVWAYVKLNESSLANSCKSSVPVTVN